MATSITIGGINITPEELQSLAQAVTEQLQTTAKDPSQYPTVETVAGITSLPVFRQNGAGYELVRLLTSALKGADGRQVELTMTNDYVRWRLAASAGAQATAWQNLIPISVLQQPAADAVELYGQEIEQLRRLKFDYAEKTDEGLCFFADGQLVGGPVEVGSGSGSGGGSGGGGGSTIRLINQGASSMGVAAGQQVVISYIYTSTDAETGEPTGDGTVQYYVNNVKVATQFIRQGANAFDATPYLTAGTNAVRVQVTDSYGATRSMNVSVAVMSLSLTSPFDDGIAYDEPLTFPFTPVGSGQKTVYFVLDGSVVGSIDTTATNRQLTYQLGALGHGFHLLKVYAEMTVQGVTIRSNELVYGITYVEAGVQTVIISSPFVRTSAEQYETLVLPFTVYNPMSLTTPVTLQAKSAGGEWQTVSTLTVDRNRQTWSYRIGVAGDLQLKIVAGQASVSFQIDVSASSISADAETEGLQLFLTATGRNNAENNPAEWSYESISATLTGFNFKTNGWLPDASGATVLRLNSGAAVNIPLQPFAQDFKNTGKTVEFEFSVRDVEDFTFPMISCLSGGRGFQITPNQMDFASQLSSLSAKFKEDEIIRLSIVVENRFDKRLIFLYINGVASSAQQYSPADDFSQPAPVNISLTSSPDLESGDTTLTLDIYNIRVYNQALNSYQILNNYIADTSDVQRKLALFDRNQIYDGSGEIVYANLVEKIPCMTITGILPTFKGDKKIVKTVFEHRSNPEKSFTSENVQIDVQGTSSQFYPRKNFKTKHNSGFLMTETGQQADKYVLQGNDIPAKVFCEKADFAESSGTHNTGLAKFFNDLLLSQNIKTPPQNGNANVRTTVDGYPIAIFHKEEENSIPMFVGKYNFNHDKDAQDVFGLTGNAECWEFLNNTSDICLFKSADFSGTWTDDVSARYPDGFQDNTNIKAVWEWIVSCKDNPSKFAAEFTRHFNKNCVISYYVLTELFGMVDQRAKNQFLTSWGNEGSGDWKWYFIFYDNDTVNGINNEGEIAFGYNIEDTDTIGSGHVYNGYNSEFWKLVVASFADDIKTMYHNMRTSGALSYDRVARVLNVEQCAKWCEVVYNMDGQYKYIQPIVESGNASYLYALQGSRIEHRKWWLKNRFYYIDSKYNTGDFLSDFITMRLYTPSAWQGVAPDANFALTLFKDSYVRVKYGSYVIGQRAQAGDTVAIQAPNIQFNDTETIVYGVSGIKSLGSLAAKYPGTVDVSSARKLTELIAGSDAAGYQNLNLTHIAIGNNTLLKRVDVRNCPNLTEPLDVSGCNNIREIYADGTNISMAVLPPAGVLSLLRLPASITNLTVKNQPNLTADGIFVGAAKISDMASLPVSTLVMENMNHLNIPAILQAAKNGGSLNRIRIVNINVEADNLTLFKSLVTLQGVDEQGNSISLPVITGEVNITGVAYQSEVAALQQVFPELEIKGNIQGDPVTTFVFNSSQSLPIAGAKFTCNKPFTKVNDTTYTVTAAPGTALQITFACDLHETREILYTVAATATRTYTAAYVPLRTLNVVMSGNPVPGATVTVDGDTGTWTTDAAGKASIRRRGAFTGLIDSPTGGGTFSVADSTTDTQQTVSLTAHRAFTITLYADDFMFPLSGAEITIGSQTVLTDSEGVARFLKPAGTYTYAVKWRNLTASGSTGTIYDNTQITHRFKIPITEFIPVDDGSVQFADYSYSASYLTVVFFNGATVDFTIDWGDGTTSSVPDEIFADEGKAYFRHFYKKEGARQIKILSPQHVTNVSSDNIRAFWHLGNSALANMKANSNFYYLAPDFFKNDALREDFSFSAISMRIDDIPAGLLDNCISMNNVDYMFTGAWIKKTGYNVFPDSDFGNRRIERVFMGCFFLEEAEFPKIRTSGVFADIFANCSELKKVTVFQPVPPLITKDCFSGTHADLKIYVPAASVNAYKAAPEWSNLADRIFAMT